MSLRPIQSLRSMPLQLILLTIISLVAYVTQQMPHNITSGLCHSLELGSNTMTYVTKESYVINHYPTKAYATKVCFNSKLVYYVNRTYATKTRVKAYVTQVYNITKVVLTLVLCKCH
jgi:hypothetical protein